MNFMTSVVHLWRCFIPLGIIRNTFRELGIILLWSCRCRQERQDRLVLLVILLNQLRLPQAAQERERGRDVGSLRLRMSPVALHDPRKFRWLDRLALTLSSPDPTWSMLRAAWVRRIDYALGKDKVRGVNGCQGLEGSIEEED